MRKLLNDKQREEFDKVLNNYTEIDQKAEEELTEVFFERII